MLRVYYASVASLDISDLSALPEHRRAKVDALHGIDDKRRSAGAWLLLSRAIALLGLPTVGEYAHTDTGKPYFVGSNVHFSLSHSGDFVAVAVSDSPCGVDIERIGRYRSGIVRRYFTKDEADFVSDDEVRFTEVWTRKEAVVKARGTGLGDFASFSAVSDAPPYRLTTLTAHGYVISTAGNGYAEADEIVLREAL